MKRSIKILMHVGYWALYLMLVSLFVLFINAGVLKDASGQKGYIWAFIRLMISLTLIPGIFSFYTFYFFLFNNYLSRKKFALLFFYGSATVIVSGLIGLGFLKFLSGRIMAVNNALEPLFYIVLFMSILALIHGIIALVMKGFFEWYADIKVKELLQQRNFEIELALVKSQLTPHFLFNTINNIDVLIEKDAKLASYYLNKLSDIMRFMLYQTKTEEIPLDKEIEYIDKYIELQKIRSANGNFINYTITGNRGDWMIAPMLFIPFLENAFKHASNKINDDSIRVNIGIEKERLLFTCQNNFSLNPLGFENAGGLGNDLIIKRIAIIYRGKHTLKIERKNNVHKVQLVIFRDIQSNLIP